MPGWSDENYSNDWRPLETVRDQQRFLDRLNRTMDEHGCNVLFTMGQRADWLAAALTELDTHREVTGGDAEAAMQRFAALITQRYWQYHGYTTVEVLNRAMEDLQRHYNTIDALRKLEVVIKYETLFDDEETT